MLHNKILSGLLVFLFAAFAVTANAVSIDSDSRVKTLVYDDNDVFTVNAEAGFQTDIELAPNETVDTISVGDSFGWQITPAGHRLFIKPLQKSGITNLSVITNRHSYQFELVAVPPGSHEGHAYVVKFYYPDQSQKSMPQIDRSRSSTRPISATAIPELPSPNMQLPAPPMPAAPQMPGTNNYQPIPVSAAGSGSYNYNYTLTGPDSLAPTKIYDDGKSTFFEFKSLPNAQLSAVGQDGSQTPINAQVVGPNSISVDKTAAQFIIKDNSGNQVTVYNENMKLPQIPTSRSQ